MPRLGNLEFDDRILDALKERKLVVFAGAGVSMGPPSNLDSFWRLTEKIANGTGLQPELPLDRFLGSLQHRGVSVHERAVQLLSPEGSAPTELHRNLIRLFGAVDRIKLVTTNFDLHFESAAREAFGTLPDIYRAPALPLGYDFNGIVHVHGALPHAPSIVLTDSDFGKAYLTEGWARRFLLDVFRSYTVLFVGYSHDDVVMNYLARALPSGGSAGRFALADTDANWNLLGIRPIRFIKGEGDQAFRDLYHGVAKLAERSARGALDWQSRMHELVGRAPPVDPELVDEIEHALRDVPNSRFFTDVARDVAWLKWLDDKGKLDALFRPGEIDERNELLASWIAKHYAIDHFSECFELIAGHELKINPRLWHAIGRELGLNREKAVEGTTLKRWISLLLLSPSENDDRHVLMWLAQRCSALELTEQALALFLRMCTHRFELRRGFSWQNDDKGEQPKLEAECAIQTDHWVLNEVYEKQIKPHLEKIAQPLLSGLHHRFESIHTELASWSRTYGDWDSMTYRRSAIEPHEQDHYAEAVDVLIDAARDALDWLRDKTPLQLDAWIEQFTASRPPLLRRLAVHSMASHPTKSADERIVWALQRIGLDSTAEHHEIHRLVAINYPAATDTARRTLIDAIAARHFSGTADRPSEIRALRFQFDWLSWLLAAKPDCTLAEAALTPIREQFPQWITSEHPDLTHWTGSAGWVGSESPWSPEQLISQPPHGQLEALLEFKGTSFDGPDREGLLSAIRDATKTSPQWGFGLAAELEARTLWSSDLWSAVLQGLQDADLNDDQWRQLIGIVSRDPLQIAHARDIADILFGLVKGNGKPAAAQHLTQANEAAERLWSALPPDNDANSVDDWPNRSINRSAGVLIEYWIAALSLTLKDEVSDRKSLPTYYRERFTTLLQDTSSKGAYARVLLAGQVSFLFRLDEEWTHEHIIPLFQDADQRVFAQAWQGFLVWGRLYPALADALLPAFMGAIRRSQTDLPDHSSRLVEFYVSLCAFHTDDPFQELLPNFFQHATMRDRVAFASHIELILRQIESQAINKLWNGWLSHYWSERLQGVLGQLAPQECKKMLGWLTHLGDNFPAAVSLAIQMPLSATDQGHILFDLRESDLVSRFPEASASLLIYLAAALPSHHADDLTQVADRLNNLAPPLDHQLREALARAGAG